MLYETGVRVSELCDLNIEDISNEDHTALIMTKKGTEKGWIVWTDDLHELMIKFLGVRLCMNGREHLFVTERGHNRPTTRTIERWVDKVVKESGINKHIVVHSFRHGKAHFMIDHGADIVAVAKALRHSEKNPMGAFSYIRLNQKESEKILRKFLPQRPL
jgi:site-specific recombinase XerD